MNEIIKQVGRRAIEVIFPNGNFTITDLSEQYPHVSKVTLQQKVNVAMSRGLVMNVGQVESQLSGRKRVIYSKSNALKVAESLVN